MVCSVSEPRPARLRRGAIGPVGLAALAIGVLSPALGLYALWPPMQAQAGPVAPLIYLCAMLVALPTACSYAVLNSSAPSAGAGSTWLWQAWSPAAGYLLGLVMVTYLTIGAIAQPLLFGLFVQDLLASFGMTATGRMPMFLSIAASTGLVMLATRRGVETSIRIAVVLMLIESAVVVALALTVLYVLAQVPGGIHFGPFNPHHATGGVAGFWAALIIGVLAFAGFDVVSTAAEEADAPRRQIPLATLLTVLGIGAFWIATSWVYTLSAPPALVASYTHQGVTAVTPIARLYWGAGSILIILTAFTGIIAIYNSSLIAASRLIFALARHRLLPSPLARLHPVHRVPTSSLRLLLLVVCVASTITILVSGNGVDGFVWWSNAMVFFLTLTFAGVNLANMLYFMRVSPHRFRWHLNVAVPLLGLAANGYLLYEAFFRTLLIADAGAGRTVIYFCVAVLLLWCCCVVAVLVFAPQRLRGAPPVHADREGDT
jgi:amino acid transporter